MRDLTDPQIDRWRVKLPDAVMRLMGVTDADGMDLRCNGAFSVPVVKTDGSTVKLTILAASEGGWDHVSVRLDERCPTWLEMSAVHRIFFGDDEVAMQLHVPSKDHVNNHPFCLHLWRPWSKKIPLPPRRFV
jgi:hypothetical protein